MSGRGRGEGGDRRPNAALWESVNGLRDDQAAIREAQAAARVEFQGFGGRIGKLETQVADLRTHMDASFDEVKVLARSASSRPTPWAVVLALLALVMSGQQWLSSLQLEPVRHELARQSESDEAHDSAMLEMMDSRFRDTDGEKLEARMVGYMDQRMDAHEARLSRIQAQFVEHVSNGHPHTVIERLERSEEMNRELRGRMLEVEKGQARLEATVRP